MQPPAAGVSRFHEEWKRALISDDVLLAELLRREPPGVAIFEIAGFINGIYRAEQKLALLNTAAGSQRFPAPALRPRVEKLLVELSTSRRQLGWDQREVDIALLRWIRGSGTLSPVLGAGVSQAAGAPGWSELVKALLTRALRAGHEVSRMVPSPRNPPEAPIQITEEGELRITGTGRWTVERQVLRVEHFTPGDESKARNILTRLEGGESGDSEL